MPPTNATAPSESRPSSTSDGSCAATKYSGCPSHRCTADSRGKRHRSVSVLGDDMYNGNGNRYSGTRGIRPLYLYIGIGALVLLGIWLIMSLLRPGIEGYFALAAGILLLLGNVRDLLLPANPQQRSNIALLNS